MKRCLKPVLIMCCSLLPGMALAANLPYSLSVTPFAGGYVFEGNQHISNRPVYGLSIGYNFSEHWGAEITGSAIPQAATTAPPQQTWDFYEVRGDFLYHFRSQERLVPYLAAGGGLLLGDRRKFPTDHDFLADYGAGIKYFLNDTIALRADVRHILRIEYKNESYSPRNVYNNFAYTAGVTFQLGGVKPAAPRVLEEQKPVQAVTPPPPVAEETKSAPVPIQEPAAAPPEAPVPAPAPEAPLTLTAEKGELAAAPAAAILLTGITIDKDSLEIVTTKHIGAYKTFTLSQPSRLVIDVAGAANGLGVKRIPVHRFGITAVRFGDHPDFLRIVLDASQGRSLPYRIEETGKGLKVIMTSP